MFKFLKVFVYFVAIMFVASVAQAGVWDSVKGWLSTELLGGIAALLTIALGILAKKVTSLSKIKAVAKEAGEAIQVIAEVLADNKITSAELKRVSKEIKDISIALKS